MLVPRLERPVLGVPLLRVLHSELGWVEVEQSPADRPREHLAERLRRFEAVSGRDRHPPGGNRRGAKLTERRYRGGLGQVCRCVRRRFCAGTGSWSGGDGRIRTDGRRGGRRSIVGYRRSSFNSHPRTRLGATGGSSANCEASASRFQRHRCGRSSSATVCGRRRSETSSPGATSSANKLRRRSPAISSPSRRPG
jgi:hypothetical protein